MKIIKWLVVVISVSIGTAQASVVRYLQVSGTVSAYAQCETSECTPAPPVSFDLAPTQAILDSSGVLSFTITDHPRADLNPLQVAIHGVFGGDGLFTPQSSMLTAPSSMLNPTISAVSAYGLQEQYSIVVFSTPLYFTDNFTFSETCPTTDATAGCGAPIFASAVPVPASVWLFGSGLLGLTTTKRRRQH
jgi:hypothetical protein